MSNSNEAVNSELGKGLIEFNTSPGRRDYGYATYIPVTPVLQTEVKHPNTRNYSMTRNPRGKAIIFNIVPTEVVREAYRFYYIFEQLLFEVQMQINLTTTQIKHQLAIISNEMLEKEDKGEERDEALIGVTRCPRFGRHVLLFTHQNTVLRRVSPWQTKVLRKILSHKSCFCLKILMILMI